MPQDSASLYLWLKKFSANKITRYIYSDISISKYLAQSEMENEFEDVHAIVKYQNVYMPPSHLQCIDIHQWQRNPNFPTIRIPLLLWKINIFLYIFVIWR